jgi:hypothetical protein
MTTATRLGVVVLCGVLAAPGCEPSGTPNVASPVSVKTAAPDAGATPAAACAVKTAWLEKPEMPGEVLEETLPEDQQNCAFHQFAWQMALYLTSPADPRAPHRGLVFQGYVSDTSIFVGGNQPAPGKGSTGPILLRQVDRTAGEARGERPAADELPYVAQAGSEAPLVDRNRRWVQYGVSVNPVEYKYLTSCELYRSGCFDAPSTTVDFPNGSVELKTAWRVVETCALPDSPRKDCKPEDTRGFFTTRAIVSPYGVPAGAGKSQEVTVALVGFHVIQKTENHPEWIWSTFEHVNNAPDCKDPQPAPPGGWTFNTNQGPDCPECNKFKDVCGGDGKKWRDCDKPQNPTQVCRVNPHGEDPAKPDATNTGNLVAINESARALLSAKGSVWSNYALVGVNWRELDPKEHRNRMRALKGSLLAANTVAETYTQGKSCLGCHYAHSKKLGPPRSADYIHIFAAMQSGGGACGARPECPGAKP